MCLWICVVKLIFISLLLLLHYSFCLILTKLDAHDLCVSTQTRGQSNLTKSASRGAHSPVKGHPRGSKVVPLNSWGRVSY